VHSSLSMKDIGLVLEKLQTFGKDLPAAERAALHQLLSSARVVATDPPEYNPFLPGAHADPYPAYHHIQARNPLHWSHAMQAWVISRYRDVVDALRDPRMSYRTGYDTIMRLVPIDEHESIKGVSAFFASLLNEIDPPDHTRLRRMMVRALSATSGGAANRRAHIASVANCLVDAVGEAGQMDLVDQFAYPLPASVGADLLGIPVSDRAWFGKAVHDVVHTFSEGFSRTTAMQRGEAAISEVERYFKGLLAERRKKPGPDVLSALLEIPDASEQERVLIAANIILGMHENVTNAISLGLRALLEGGLLTGPRRDAEALATATEEVLRFEGTAPILSRVVIEDVQIGDLRIARGQRVILLLAAANRDAAAFNDPDRFVATRRPNPHIAFGVGRRACPGAAIGRSILQVALDVLPSRLPMLRLAESAPAWRQEINVRGLSALNVAWN
jgi:cytochrome P450